MSIARSKDEAPEFPYIYITFPLSQAAQAATEVAEHRAKKIEFAKAFHTRPVAPHQLPSASVRAPAAPKDVEMGFLNTIIQRANNGGTPVAPAATGAAMPATLASPAEQPVVQQVPQAVGAGVAPGALPRAVGVDSGVEVRPLQA